MFARLLLIPFAAMAIAGLYLAYEKDEAWTWLLIVAVTGGAAIFILGDRINWWYYNRRPPDVDGPVRMLLERHDPYYRALSPAGRLLFRQRMALFFLGNDFMPQGWEAVPHDMEAVVAAAATKVRFNREGAIYPDCQRIVVYPGPFPSPAHPEEWHRSEWYAADGVLLFAGRDLMEAYLHPGQFPDIAVYEYIRVLRDLEPDLPWPAPSREPETEIRAISGWTADRIRALIGLRTLDLEAMRASLWFSHPERMREVCPELWDMYARIFERPHTRNPLA